MLQALPGSTSTVSVDTVPSNASGTAAASPLAKNQGKQYFSYDRVFAPQDDQGTIFGVAEDLIGKFIEGYNVTCLAYGQTSSGKSYTCAYIGTYRLMSG